MRYENKPSRPSLELVVLGLIAALVLSLAFPVFSHIAKHDAPMVSTEPSPPHR